MFVGPFEVLHGYPCEVACHVTTRSSFNTSRKVPAVLNGSMRINYRGADLETVAVLSSFAALLSLIGTKEWHLSFLTSGCSVRYL